MRPDCPMNGEIARRRHAEKTVALRNAKRTLSRRAGNRLLRRVSGKPNPDACHSGKHDRKLIFTILCTDRMQRPLLANSVFKRNGISSRKENASKRESGSFRRFHETMKGSSALTASGNRASASRKGRCQITRFWQARRVACARSGWVIHPRRSDWRPVRQSHPALPVPVRPGWRS